ncbi:MAG: hypothetical protein H6818_01975 [Phycisphaerales bacterium]|nr:hypothetical protein [Phycisphaerales bacterium]
MDSTTSTIQSFLGKNVVFDTAGPVTYLGTLASVESDGFILENADIRDRHEGHVSKEKYICDAKAHGIQANRARIFVFRDAVISVSSLDDVIGE